MNRLVRRAVLPLALLSSGVAAVPTAAAATDPDPSTTNIPYLAWRGEHVRIVKCSPVFAPDLEFGPDRSVTFEVVDWSGLAIGQPVQFEGTSEVFYASDQEQWCGRVTVSAEKAGLAKIKMVAKHGSTPVMTHIFNVAWMSLQTPAIDEIGENDSTGLNNPPGEPLGDPLGDGIFNAGANDGRIRVTVKGTLPLLNNYAELGIGAAITLPDQWATLAQALATDADVLNATPWMRWDIHDDDVETASGLLDPVDNHAPDPLAPDAWTFSRLATASLTSGPSRGVGPFDPVRPDETLVSDGVLNWGDAPMPAARVDVTIRPNTGVFGDKSGLGTLHPVSKQMVYSRDGTGNGTHENIYAPFNEQFIPATARRGLSSGIDGGIANNFNGFLTGTQWYESTLYRNWDVARTLAEGIGTWTHCLRRQNSMRYEQLADYRWTPYGPQSVAVYTDEHGEAQVAYRPGIDFFPHLHPAVIFDNNDGCDLRNVVDLGYSDITATARYPYQPVTDPAKTSLPLRKVVNSLFSKTITYWPKASNLPNPETNVVRIVAVHAQDVDGDPFQHEVVCFAADHNAEAMLIFKGVTGPASAPIDTRGSYKVNDPEGINRLCVTTNELGNAAVEVLNSNPTRVNVIANFVEENLFRHLFADFAIPGSSSDTTQPPASPVPPTVKPVASKPLYTLAFIRTVTIKGSKYLVIRVNSAKKKALVRIQFRNKAGKLIASRLINIRTNRTFRLTKPKMTKQMVSVKVKVIRVR
jgi:hypothetical protein